ncbi:hypothetical protein ADIWIN_2082 [Winogradskyella psychrotolerans RS-3]|uniref:HEPN domain-containing protein n=1 Tax=Winogradskyella psychrotolerans RS-3 TaxID=641526 RepID=S7X1T4_9FLAO|nr:HEPN domain-containing protein [Winogradskyella psychrotolerans]EPR72994.1 hypothetical protein ADIWIN_2082 [Winogradskyella psychrotolerans RS-3]
MKENLKLAKKLFQTAEIDLNAVEILYNNENYSIALFQLQQSVEKFVKSYGIRMEIIKPEDLARKISHLPHKVFTRQYSSKAEELIKLDQTPLLIADMIPPHQRDKSKTKEKIKKLQYLHDAINNADVPKYKDIKRKDLNQFINELKEFEKEEKFDDEKIYNDIKEDFVKTHEHFLEYFKQFNDDFLINDVKKRLEHTEDYVNHQVLDHKFKFRQDEKMAYVSYAWINLSLITAPHEQSTRYPSISNDETPKNYYTNENVVIEFIPTFIEIMRKTINKFNEVYE